jgi:Cof subfamily protein (haloacid dehalogenase superfamily)
MIRLVVSDVDGTLLRHDKSIAPSTIAAAGRLRAAGIKLAVVSSRPPQGMDALRAPLGLDTPRAGFNGGAIEDASGKLVEEHTIAVSACREVVALCETAGADVWVFAAGAWFLKNPDAPHVPREHRATGMNWQLVDDFSPHLASVHKIMASSDDFALTARLEHELQARVGGEASVLRSQSYYVDVTHPAANKGNAALSLARLLGVAPAELAVLGDMPNDVPMFRIAGLSIAMGNASDAVKAEAKAVTGDNDSDGWASAIDRFILPAA